MIVYQDLLLEVNSKNYNSTKINNLTQLLYDNFKIDFNYLKKLVISNLIKEQYNAYFFMKNLLNDISKVRDKNVLNNL